MKLKRPAAPSRLRAQAASIFDEFDAFLTDLIMERVNVDARTGLSNWMAAGVAAKAVQAKRRNSRLGFVC